MSAKHWVFSVNDIGHHFHQLKLAQEAFLNQLYLGELVQAVVYTTADLLRFDEGEDVTLVQPERLDGRDAQSSAIHAYRDWYILSHRSSKLVRRYPGVLQLTGDTAWTLDTAAAVANLNHCKQLLESAVVAAGNTQHARWLALRAVAPGVVANHLYRQVHCVADGHSPVASVTFAWARREVARRTSKDVEITRLSAAGVHLDVMERLDQVPEDADLLRCRPMRLQPMMTVRTIAPARVSNHVAALPVLILQEQPVKVGQLAPFDLSAAPVKQSRAKRTQREAVIPEVGLFVVATAHRSDSD